MSSIIRIWPVDLHQKLLANSYHNHSGYDLRIYNKIRIRSNHLYKHPTAKVGQHAKHAHYKRLLLMQS